MYKSKSLLVDKIILEYITDYCNLIIENKKNSYNNLVNFIYNKYEKDYNYGIEYYYNYKIIDIQDCKYIKYKKIIICLYIYRDEELKKLQQESEERLRSGL